MDSFLTLRGIKTLHVRMERHCSNAKQIAVFLKNHPKIDKVYWPGFEDHPNHQIAKSQMNDFGGMISFVPKGSNYHSAVSMMEKLKIFTIAESPTFKNFGFSSSIAPVCGLIFATNSVIVAATCAV